MSQTIFTLDIDVNGTEIGPGRVLHASHIFRYLERARWRLFHGDVSGGRLIGGVVRAQTAEIRAALNIDEKLVLKTWIARVGRTSFDFGHSLERPDGEQVVASRCTVVQIGPKGPTEVDPALAEHVIDTPAPKHAAQPGLGDAPAFEQGFVIRPSDTDFFGHMNQARYVDLFDDARKLAAKAGHEAGDEGRLASLSIEYEREALASDAVVARVARAQDGARNSELWRGEQRLTRAVARFV